MDLPLSTLAQEPEVGAVVEVVAAPEAVEAVAYSELNPVFV